MKEFSNKNFLKRFILNYDVSIAQCLVRLNELKIKVIFVSKNNKIIGSITDGDIRRALISSIELNTKIELICNKKFKFVLENSDSKFVIDIFNKNNIEAIPVLNKSHFLISIYTLKNINKINNDKSIPVVIMAGGMGKRLMPHTVNTPKPLLKVLGQPLIVHIINNCKMQGFKNFIISINYLGSKIKNFLGVGKKFGVNIKYIEEKNNLGTAGALINIYKKFRFERVFVINGDVITKINLNEFLSFHIKKNSDATMACKQYVMQNPYGVINQRNFRIRSINEKPKYESFVNAGVYILDLVHFSNFKKDQKLDMTQYFEKIIRLDMRAFIFPIFEEWIELGTIEEFDKYA